MHLNILTYIILPNVGYWKGTEIVSKKELNYTKNLLSMCEAKEYSRGNCCELHRSRKYKVLEYKIDGLFHREGDLPACEYENNEKQQWYKKGKLHRKGDLPATIWGNYKYWYKNGNKHRKGDLPAVIEGKLQLWYKKGKLHRKSNLPAYIYENRKEWWKNGEKIGEEISGVYYSSRERPKITNFLTLEEATLVAQN